MIINCTLCEQPTDLTKSIIVRFDEGRRKDYFKYKCSQCNEIAKELVTQERQEELGNGGVSTLSNLGDIEPEIDNYIENNQEGAI